MAPAGVIEPSRRWKHSGHHETQKPQSRYGIIDLLESNASFAFADAAQFQKTHGSVWPPIIFHASWNSLIQGVFDQSTKETSIWLGESGIVVALVNLVLTVCLVRGRWSIKHTPSEETANQVSAMTV